MSIEAMKQALEALEWNYGTDLENIENCTAWLDKLNATIPALRQSIEQAEKQEPAFYVIPATDRFGEGYEQTFWEDPAGFPVYTRPVYASDISQEPVDETAKDRHELAGTIPISNGGIATRTPSSFISPPKRHWVGLTDEEINEAQDTAAVEFKKNKYRIRGQMIMPGDSPDWWFARAIEAKLKEKNCG